MPETFYSVHLTGTARNALRQGAANLTTHFGGGRVTLSGVVLAALAVAADHPEEFAAYYETRTGTTPGQPPA